jgi:hypothetical protein
MAHRLPATLLTLGLAAGATATDHVTFTRVKGTYSSSVLDGCSLELDRHGNVVMNLEAADLELADKAVTREGRIGIHSPREAPPGEILAIPPPVAPIP